LNYPFFEKMDRKLPIEAIFSFKLADFTRVIFNNEIK